MFPRGALPSGASAPHNSTVRLIRSWVVIHLFWYPSCVAVTSSSGVQEDPAGPASVSNFNHLYTIPSDSERDPRLERTAGLCVSWEMPARFYPRIQFEESRALVDVEKKASCLHVYEAADKFITISNRIWKKRKIKRIIIKKQKNMRQKSKTSKKTKNQKT